MKNAHPTQLLALQQILTEHPPERAALEIVKWMLHDPSRMQSRWPAVYELVRSTRAPALWRALGVLALWPRSPALQRQARACIAETSGHSCWRTFVAVHGGIALAQGYAYAGSTAAGDPASLEYFRAALLEDSMLCGQRWTRDRFLAEVWPAFSDLAVLWGDYDERGLVNVSHDIAHLAGDFIGVPHPVEMAPELAQRLREEHLAEAFAQTQRWHERSTPESDRRLDRGVQGFAIEDRRMYGRLRQLGWRRGQIMDFPQFFELALTWLGRGGVSAFVRFAPGIDAKGPQGTDCTLSEIGYAPADLPVPWGKYDDSRDEYGTTSQPEAEPLPRLDELLSRRVGLRLEQVDPVIRSETRRTLHLLLGERPLWPWSGPGQVT